MPFVNQALKASEGVADLSIAMRGLIAAAIDADMRRMTGPLPQRAISGRPPWRNGRLQPKTAF